MTLIEAMHFGAVPVAFDSFLAARDIITDGEDGHLVAPFRIDEYAARLATLLVDGGQRARLGEAARRSARRYRSHVIGAAWMRLLASLPVA